MTSQHALKLVCKHSDVNMIQMQKHMAETVRYIWCLLALRLVLNYLRSEHLVSQKCDILLGDYKPEPNVNFQRERKNRYFPHVICILNFHHFSERTFYLPSLFLSKECTAAGFLSVSF